MAARKDRLSTLLSAWEGSPEIRRGHGLRLSTEHSEVGDKDVTPQDRTNAESHSRTPVHSHERIDVPAYKRVNRGYALREDLVKALKRIALEEDRTLYDVMDEAMTAYVASRQLPSRPSTRHDEYDSP